MAIAETAELAVLLKLQDQLTAPLAATQARIKELEATTGTAATGVGNLEKRTTSFGNALTHAKGQLSGLVSGLSGLFVGGALAGVGIFFTKSIQEAQTFGANVAKVVAVTGLATEKASAMTDTLDKWGVSTDRILPLLGRMERNVGAIADKSDGLLNFQTKYGVSLADTSGKIKDANELLLLSADYFNSSASATDKATFMSKLYGRAWQDLIPILSKGSDFIRAQEADAIHLTAAQMANITAFRDAQRDFADSFGDVQVKIGADLMPLLSRSLKDVSSWLDSHGDEVADFFKGAVSTVQDAVGAIGSVFSAVQAGWNAIPPEIRDILVKGFVADKTVKFLFGFDPASMAGDALKGFVMRGGTPANPLFVANVTGGGKGIPGVPIAEGGVKGLLGGLLGVFSGFGLGTAAVTVGAVIGTGLAINEMQKSPTLITAARSKWGLVGQGITNGPSLQGFDQRRIDSLAGDSGTAGLVGNLGREFPMLRGSLSNLTEAMRNPEWLQALKDGWRKFGEVTRAQLNLARSDIEKGVNLTKAAEFLGKNVNNRGAGSGGPAFIHETIRELKAALMKTYDPGETSAITKAIHQLRGRLPEASQTQHLLDKAERIATSSRSTSEKLHDLKAELRHIESPGLHKKVEDLIDHIKDTGTKVDKSKDKISSKMDDSKRAITDSERTTTGSVNTARTSIVHAIAAAYSRVPVVNLFVTASTVEKSITYQNRNGPGNGSQGGGRGDGVRGGPI